MNADNKNFQKRFALYMDILGASDAVAKYYSTLLEIAEEFERMKNTFQENKPDFSLPEISSFSDMILMSYPISYAPFGESFTLGILAAMAVRVHRIALKNGFLVRGSITKARIQVTTATY